MPGSPDWRNDLDFKEPEEAPKPSKDELIVLTHNDLDALGCMLQLEYRFPKVKKFWFHTNYVNLNDVITIIEARQRETETDRILVMDVSFADNKGALRRLRKVFKRVTVIDHHLYPLGFWDDLDVTVHHDKTVCAAKLCGQVFGNVGKSKNLDNLTEIIDIYDCWRIEHKAFDLALDLNDYFWISHEYGYLKPLLDAIVREGYKLPKDFKEVTQKAKNDRETAYQDYESRGMLVRSGGVTVFFGDKFFPYVNARECRSGQGIVVGISPKGVVKVRLSDTALTETQKHSLRETLTGATTGHLNAFTYKGQGKTDVPSLVLEAKRVTDAINDLLS